jgi:hypothetical protein
LRRRSGRCIYKAFGVVAVDASTKSVRPSTRRSSPGDHRYNWRVETLASAPDSVASSDAAKRRFKKVTTRYRRSAAKDRKAIAATRNFTPPPILQGAAPLVLIPTPHHRPGNDAHNSPSHPQGLSLPKNARNDGNKGHAWSFTTDLGKLTSAYRVLEATGKGVAFSLDCSPDEIVAAQRHPNGFADYFKRRISRTLKRALGYVPLHGFGVDVARDDRLHIHGAIAANDNQLAAIEKALRQAGGKWASKWHTDKQCQFKVLSWFG